MPSDYPMPSLTHAERQCVLVALLLREKEIVKILEVSHAGSDSFFIRELEETQSAYEKIQSHF